MDPVTMAAVMAGTQLLGGLFGGAAQAAQQKRQAILQAGQSQFGMEQAARQQGEEQQKGALGNLVESYRSALLGGGQ